MMMQWLRSGFRALRPGADDGPPQAESESWRPQSRFQFPNDNHPGLLPRMELFQWFFRFLRRLLRVQDELPRAMHDQRGAIEHEFVWHRLLLVWLFAKWQRRFAVLRQYFSE